MVTFFLFFFLHCLLTLELWYKLFRLTRLDKVSPRSISDMTTISFRGLENSIRGKVSMAYCLPCVDLDSMVGKKCKDL